MSDMAAKLLIVDDDRDLLELIKMRLASSGYEVTAATSVEEAHRAITATLFDAAVLDLQLDGKDGLALMQDFHRISPGMPVLILTAHGSIESAVESMKRGAYTYLTKPFDAQELIMHLEHALENRKLSAEVNRLKELLAERYDFRNIVARSTVMTALLEAVSRIAKTDSTVYLCGESGTGKELIARAIHLAGNRKDKPFVAINCAALPETLLESELFGHEKGAFTGAVKNTRGLFALGHEGTIFLDEIGDMPLSIQAKLLRVLQERQFYPVGSEQRIEVDVRLIAATNQDLDERVKQGLFREDLYYRIHVIPVALPPLRDRREDIPSLADYFVKKFSEQMKKNVKRIAPQALQRLMLHDWPGNVRELENTIEYAVAMTRQDVITEDLILPGKAAQEDTIVPLKKARDAFEREYLVRVLKICRGNVSTAAAIAGRYRADMYTLMKKHGVNALDFKQK